MTRKRRRLLILTVRMALLAGATAITLSALSDNITFFYSPTDLLTEHAPNGRPLRVGGLVAVGSVRREQDGKTVIFEVTDKVHEVPVVYSGQLPDLFRPGQGVVVEGVRKSDGTILATAVLAKHDARYMPRSVVEALKKAGRWHETAQIAKSQ